MNSKLQLALCVVAVAICMVIGTRGLVNAQNGGPITPIPLCSALRGSGTAGTFSLAAPTITIDANCTGATSYDIQWGDGSGTSTQGSSTLTANHTYPSAGPWFFTLNESGGQTPQFGRAIVGFPTVQTDFLSGQQLNLAAYLAVTTFGTTDPITAQVTCANVVAPDGTLLPAANLGITCGPQTVVLTPTFDDASESAALPASTTPTLFQVTTTGTASTFALTRPQSLQSRAPLILAIALLAPVFGLGSRRRWLRRYLTPGLTLLLCLAVTSCGGGFKSPQLVSSVTPPGSYQLNIILDSTTTGFVQITLIVPLTVIAAQ